MLGRGAPPRVQGREHGAEWAVPSLAHRKLSLAGQQSVSVRSHERDVGVAIQGVEQAARKGGGWNLEDGREHPNKRAQAQANAHSHIYPSRHTSSPAHPFDGFLIYFNAPHCGVSMCSTSFSLLDIRYIDKGVTLARTPYDAPTSTSRARDRHVCARASHAHI